MQPNNSSARVSAHLHPRVISQKCRRKIMRCPLSEFTFHSSFSFIIFILNFYYSFSFIIFIHHFHSSFPFIIFIHHFHSSFLFAFITFIPLIVSILFYTHFDMPLNLPFDRRFNMHFHIFIQHIRAA